MLPRSQRLRAGSDISQVSRSGSRARSGDILVAIRPAASAASAQTAAAEPRFRAAVVVGKPAGNAVARNRLRRRLQHALVALGPAVPAGAELVVRSGPATAALSPTELDAELRSAVVRAGRRAGLAETGVG